MSALISPPVLNIIMLDTYDNQTLALADASFYPSQFHIILPTIQITPPSFPTITMPFEPGNAMIFNSDILGITCNNNGCLSDLPDGIYTIKYTLSPPDKFFVERSFLRVNLISSKIDHAYLKLDLFHCDSVLKKQYTKTLEEIEFYLQGAVSAANKCAAKLATELYNKAWAILTSFISDTMCCTSI